MDAGIGLLEVLDALPAPTTVLCDVQTTLYDAPRLFGPQKGATPEQVVELERRFRSLDALAPFAALPGSGAAGGLGAALASLGAELVPGAATILDLLGFDALAYDLVVTGEGRVDATTAEGKAPAEVVRRCDEAGVPCVLFGGVVTEPLARAETVPLSGDPARAAEDLVELGLRLGTRLLDAAR
jgi:glycerate kinase